jgi:hypothetical protein
MIDSPQRRRDRRVLYSLPLRAIDKQNYHLNQNGLKINKIPRSGCPPQADSFAAV